MKIDKEYYKYFDKVNVHMSLEHESEDGGWFHYGGYSGIIKDYEAKFRLQNHPKGCPEYGTAKYLEYWQRQYKRLGTRKIYVVLTDGRLEKCNGNSPVNWSYASVPLVFAYVNEEDVKGAINLVDLSEIYNEGS